MLKKFQSRLIDFVKNGVEVKIGFAAVVSLAILAVAVGVAGYIYAYTNGHNDAENDGVHMFDGKQIRDDSVVVSVNITQVDPGADTTAYPGISANDFITVVLSSTEFGMLQSDSDNAIICLPDGVAVSAYVGHQDLPIDCGNAIHAVILTPR